MSEQTPSQAEGERQQGAPDEQGPSERRDVPRTTPSQAEGETREEQAPGQDPEAGEDQEGSKEWESGWSGP
ncbi:hypothetical protein ABZY42_28525 [Streptomyces sp. NPDC006622]|uniref:hypothetical protein n=1 Tax=Streptomyces sp. NPDC006622 TaxID=3155459 RepID=UPI0033A89E2A